MRRGMICISAILAVAAAGCAKKPETIAPAYVSHVQYTSWTCEQLAEESARLQSALTTSSAAQENARGNDIIGIVLIGIPVSSLSGDNVAPQIAQYKGQLVAVQQAASQKGCTPVTAQTAPPVREQTTQSANASNQQEAISQRR